ncbi:hypothetical protein [Chryseobacterium daeguense]|uniref:hypothetical protein n=1 Tax=Chryseobacterium daeguense TaxID=412438 RepID=UPI000421B600|nr:hypothetical protein [Chryseobacterium daeguense]
MKKVLLLAAFSVAGIASANIQELPSIVSTTEASQSDYLLKKIKIDEYITDTSGTTWHIYGWVDVSIGWSGPRINSYDVHMVGGGHHYHFVGKVSREKTPEGSVITGMEGSVTDEDTGGNVEIDSNIKALIFELDNNVTANNPD